MKNYTLLLTLFAVSCTAGLKISKSFNKQKQQIPGRIECEYYDTGGEGIAYHDADSINNGSGKLNPVNGNPLHEFRMKEGVDISYTKTGGIDNNPHNKVVRDSNQLYVGWTMPGEWINYAVRVTETAVYQLGVMYTANGDGIISFDLDGRPVAPQLKISSTYNSQDTVAWRQWHHWNKTDSLTSIKIRKGIHTLTLHIVDHGQMNFDYLEFTRK
ncbi:MAG: carbohydrate-binding protein [Sediminibacterium sp.]|nr:carbohydrate-binding protein [Sediminibacterium sp.]